MIYGIPYDMISISNVLKVRMLSNMPKGEPKAQTIASEKYQKKAGYMTKSFKLKRNLVEQFSEACEKQGVSQAGQLSKLMKKFIDESDTDGKVED